MIFSVDRSENRFLLRYLFTSDCRLGDGNLRGPRPTVRQCGFHTSAQHLSAVACGPGSIFSNVALYMCIMVCLVLFSQPMTKDTIVLFAFQLLVFRCGLRAKRLLISTVLVFDLIQLILFRSLEQLFPAGGKKTKKMKGKVKK